MNRLVALAAAFACSILLLIHVAPVAAANHRPVAVGVSPEIAAINPRLLTATVWDADGWRDIKIVQLRLREAGAAASFSVQYRADTGRISLLDGGSWRGAERPGAFADISGECGRIYARHCVVKGSAKTLTVSWYIGVKAVLEDRDFLVELRARDRSGAWSAWKSAASWRTPAPTILPFSVLPPDNPWNTDISAYPVHPNSAAYIASMGAGTGLHPDFGTAWEGSPIGIPYVRIAAGQPLVPISFSYPDESDPGPYPIPPGAPIEGGPRAAGDRHILILDVDNLRLHEIYDAHRVTDGWNAGSGALFDLTSNRLRPDGWTSADAAGLPIFPGLVRYEEVEAGLIAHAVRFTASRTQRGYIHPATHFASSSGDPALPPMGLRVRLKASFDSSGFSPRVRTILQAMKTYGMIVADNGSDWFVGGAPNENWDDGELHELDQVRGRDFEAVDTGPILP